MPVVNRIADMAEEMKVWRRWLHRHPELSFDLPETAAYVAARLREFGVDELHEGIAETGIVALIAGRGEGPVIGLRADMDALPIAEETGKDYASGHAGKMHACGHDGHTAMLLGAAKYLAETRNFAGTVALIFQPAEENGGGGEVMVREGIVERFGIGRVFALHTLPNKPPGSFHTCPGPIMAAADSFEITVTGRGGHAAMPHETADPVVAAVAIVQAIQTIPSRNNHTLDDLVISVTQIHAGSADNVVPGEAWINGTVRSFDKAVQALAIRRLGEIAAGQAAAYGVAARLDYHKGYPPTLNDPDDTGFATEVAREIAGEAAVDGAMPRDMGAEDFSYMLEKLPGSYLFLGQGDGPPVHHPEFDFNDDVSPAGASFFARLVERAQPLR